MAALWVMKSYPYDMDPYNQDNLIEAVSNPTQNSALNTVADCIESRGWA